MDRRMLFFERLMYIDGRTPVNCLMTARIRGAVAQESVRGALDKVQAGHPLLRANVTEHAGYPSFIFGEEPPRIPLRVVERRSDDDWRAETSAEWKTPFRMDFEPLIRLVWIRSEHISELLLVGHHCVCDGASLVTIFRELLQAIDQPELALTPYPTFESLQDLIPEMTRSDWKLNLSVRSKAALFRLFALTIKDVLPAATPGKTAEHYLIYWKADIDTSTALSLRCRSEGTSPYAAMCVAFLDAFRQRMGHEFKNKMMCPVNIRRFIRNIDPGVMFNYAPTIPLALGRDSRSGFWALARELKESMSKKIERLNAFEHLMTAEELHASVRKLISLLLQSKGSYDFAFSNVGRLDFEDIYKTFRLDCFLGVTVALPWRNATTLITTQFRGQTDLAFVSKNDFLPYSEALAIKQRAIQTLTEAIG